MAGAGSPTLTVAILSFLPRGVQIALMMLMRGVGLCKANGVSTSVISAHPPRGASRSERRIRRASRRRSLAIREAVERGPNIGREVSRVFDSH